MNKMPLSWKIKTKWYTVKQTSQQLWHFVSGHSLTRKGHEAYDYFCKVIFDNYEPETYADFLYEEELTDLMEKVKLEDRKSAAILMAGTLAKCMTPWEFHKKERKIVGN